MRLSPAGGSRSGRRRRNGGQPSVSGVGSDCVSELVGREDGEEEDEEEEEESYWSCEDDGDGDLDGGALRRRYRRARALVDSVLNKFHNGSARAVDPSVARALQQHEPRLLSLQCFVEQVRSEALHAFVTAKWSAADSAGHARGQGSIDRQREQKGDSAVASAAASAPPSGTSPAQRRRPCRSCRLVSSPSPLPWTGVSWWISVCGGYIGPGAVMYVIPVSLWLIVSRRPTVPLP